MPENASVFGLCFITQRVMATFVAHAVDAVSALPPEKAEIERLLAIAPDYTVSKSEFQGIERELVNRLRHFFLPLPVSSATPSLTRSCS